MSTPCLGCTCFHQLGSALKVSGVHAYHQHRAWWWIPSNLATPTPTLHGLPLHAGLSRLTSLRFGACCFATLPASLSGLSALKQLSLEVMPVSGGMGLMFGASRPLAFAPQLSQLTSLEDLEFYGCSLRELPPAIAGMKASAARVQACCAVQCLCRWVGQPHWHACIGSRHAKPGVMCEKTQQACPLLWLPAGPAAHPCLQRRH